MIHGLDFQLHIIFRLHNFIILSLQLLHLCLIVHFLLLKLLMILVNFLRLDLILGELVLKILFHRLYLTLYEGHDLNLVVQEVYRGATSFGSIIRTIQSVSFVSKVHRLFTLNFAIVYKAKLLLYWQTNEALSENVPLGLGVFPTIELKLI